MCVINDNKIFSNLKFVHKKSLILLLDNILIVSNAVLNFYINCILKYVNFKALYILIYAY